MSTTAHVYAIDCEVANKGRRLAASKRRVCWKFGFPCQDSVQSGLSGTDCRGQEHQVVLVWSLTSGKQRVLADGLEVHFSRQSMTDKIECSWTMKGGHELKVVAHCLTPLFKQSPDFRRFELFVDGVSFSEMSKIYELGGTGSPSSIRSAPLPPRRHRSALAGGQSSSSSSLGLLQAQECPPRRTQSLPRLEQAVDLLDLSTPVAEPQNPFSYLASPTSVAHIFGGYATPPVAPAIQQPQPCSPTSFQSPPPKTSWQHSTPSTHSSSSYGSAYSTPATPLDQATQALVNFACPQALWSPQSDTSPFAAPQQTVFVG